MEEPSFVDEPEAPEEALLEYRVATQFFTLTGIKTVGISSSLYL